MAMILVIAHTRDTALPAVTAATLLVMALLELTFRRKTTRVCRAGVRLVPRGSVTRTVVPLPACDSIARSPANCRTRSRMPRNPNPPLFASILVRFSAAIPRPSSFTSTTTFAPSRPMRIVAVLLPEWR